MPNISGLSVMLHTESLLNVDPIPNIRVFANRVFRYLLIHFTIITVLCSINYNSFVHNKIYVEQFMILFNIIIITSLIASFTVMYILYHKQYTKSLCCTYAVFIIASSLFISTILQPLDNDTVFRMMLAATTNIFVLYILTGIYILYSINYCPCAVGYISYMTSAFIILLYELTIHVSTTESVLIVILSLFIFISYLLFDIHIAYNKKSSIHYKYYIYPVTGIFIDVVVIPYNYIIKLKNYLRSYCEYDRDYPDV